MNSIWTDAILDQYTTDASQDITKRVECIYHRFYQATTSGIGVYTLPSYVRGVLSVTWRGVFLDPMNWYDLIAMSPDFVYVNSTTHNETASGTPQWYALHPTNVQDIKLYPAPSESFSAVGGDPFSPLVEDRCIVSCWRNVDLNDPLFSPPAYIARRTYKAYVLWKAYGKDGKGQDLKASQYYENVYKFLISKFTSINAGTFVSKIRGLGASVPSGTPSHPVLPSNYERN